MKLRWIDSQGVSNYEPAELPALHRRIPLARHPGMEPRGRGIVGG
jgi:hypothetical protein